MVCSSLVWPAVAAPLVCGLVGAKDGDVLGVVGGQVNPLHGADVEPDEGAQMGLSAGAYGLRHAALGRVEDHGLVQCRRACVGDQCRVAHGVLLSCVSGGAI